MLTNLSQVVQIALAASADALIENALHFGHPGCPRPPVGEVKAAHAATLAGASQCALAWSPILGQLGCSVTSIGVFTHASPQVKFFDTISNTDQRRELADLLVVIDFTKNNATDRRAQLIQAKLAEDCGQIVLDKSGTAQRNLYLKWPKFTMPSSYDQHDRDLNDPSSAGSATDGCRFGGISLNSPVRSWSQIPTAFNMDVRQGVALGSTLAAMLDGSAGRAAVIGGTDPWSTLVDELIDKTQNTNFPRSSSVPRQSMSLSFSHRIYSQNKNVHAHAGYFDCTPDRDVPDGVSGGEPSEGISILHIIVEQSD